MPGVRPAGQNIRTSDDWSSSQNNANNAWNQNFGSGSQNNNNNKNNTNSVRAVRGFTQERGRGEIPFPPGPRTCGFRAGLYSIRRVHTPPFGVFKGYIPSKNHLTKTTYPAVHGGIVDCGDADAA